MGDGCRKGQQAEEKRAVGRRGTGRNCTASTRTGLGEGTVDSDGLNRPVTPPQNKTTVRKLDKNCPTVISHSGNQRRMIKKFLEKLLELRVRPARGHTRCLWRFQPATPSLPQHHHRSLSSVGEHFVFIRTGPGPWELAAVLSEGVNSTWGIWGRGGMSAGGKGWAAENPQLCRLKVASLVGPNRGNLVLLSWACGLTEVSGGATSNKKGRSWKKWENYRGARYALLISVTNGETRSMRRGDMRAQQTEKARQTWELAELWTHFPTHKQMDRQEFGRSVTSWSCFNTTSAQIPGWPLS